MPKITTLREVLTRCNPDFVGSVVVGLFGLISTVILYRALSLLVLISMISTWLCWHMLADKVVALMIRTRRDRVLYFSDTTSAPSIELMLRNTMYPFLFFFGMSCMIWPFMSRYTYFDPFSGLVYLSLATYPVSLFMLSVRWTLNELNLRYKEGDEIKPLRIPGALEGITGLGAIIAIARYATDVSTQGWGWEALLSWLGGVFACLFALACIPTGLYMFVSAKGRVKRAQQYVQGFTYSVIDVVVPALFFAMVLGGFSLFMLKDMLTPVVFDSPSTLYSNERYGFSFEYFKNYWHELSEAETRQKSSEVMSKNMSPDFVMGLEGEEELYRDTLHEDTSFLVSVRRVGAVDISEEFLKARIAEEDIRVAGDPALQKEHSRTTYVNGAPGYEYEYRERWTWHLELGYVHGYKVYVLYANATEYRIACATYLNALDRTDEVFFRPMVESFTIAETGR